MILQAEKLHPCVSQFGSYDPKRIFFGTIETTRWFGIMVEQDYDLLYQNEDGSFLRFSDEGTEKVIETKQKCIKNLVPYSDIIAVSNIHAYVQNGTEVLALKDLKPFSVYRNVYGM